MINVFKAIRVIRSYHKFKDAWDSRKCEVVSAPTTPNNNPINSIEVRWNTLVKKATRTDNWPQTWARDGAVYMVGGDGWGFSGKGSKHSLIISKRVGNKFSDIGFGDGKCYGILALNNDLYLWTGPGSNVGVWDHTRIDRWHIKSDGRVKPAEKKEFWRFDRGIFCPTFVQHGRNNELARDKYIYSMATGASKHDGLIQNTGVFLWRQPANNLMDKQQVEYWSLHGWTRQMHFADFVFTGPSNLLSCIYVKPLNRYLMFNMREMHSLHPFRTDMAAYEAPDPWGPWHKVQDFPLFGKGHTEPSCFYQCIDPATISADGRTMRMVFSGAGTMDAYHSVVIVLRT